LSRADEAARAIWICDRLLEKATLERQKERDEGMWTLTQAAVFTGLDKGTLSRAVKEGCIDSNGMTRRNLRLDAISTKNFADRHLERREHRELQKANRA